MDYDDDDIEVTTFGGSVESHVESPAVDKKVTLESVTFDVEVEKPPAEKEEEKPTPPEHDNDKKLVCL
jgi:hypothetical protein